MINYVGLKDLMLIERILLEFDTKHKFELNFNDAYKLYEYLKNVGKITSYAFVIQELFHDEFNDTDKLKKYHEKVMNSMVEINSNEIIHFIEYLQTIIHDDNINKLIEENKFW